MKRSLGLERVFTLGQYKTLRLADTVDDIPDDLAFNEELVAKIRILQMINVEKFYRDYIKLNENINNMNMEEAFEALDKAKTTTLTDIETIIKNSNKKED